MGEEMTTSASEFDCDFRHAPICPFCGYSVGDAWELGLDDGDSTDIECEVCDREFVVTAAVEVTYSTKPMTICELEMRFGDDVRGVCRCGFEITGLAASEIRTEWEKHRGAMAWTTALLAVWGRHGIPFPHCLKEESRG